MAISQNHYQLPEVPLVQPKIGIIRSFFQNYHQLPGVPLVQSKIGIIWSFPQNYYQFPALLKIWPKSEDSYHFTPKVNTSEKISRGRSLSVLLSACLCRPSSAVLLAISLEGLVLLDTTHEAGWPCWVGAARMQPQHRESSFLHLRFSCKESECMKKIVYSRSDTKWNNRIIIIMAHATMLSMLFVVALHLAHEVVGEIQDCWDPEKLARMNFKQTPGNFKLIFI